MAICRSCNSDNAPGIRWCAICRTNLINPQIGRLSSPGKRLAGHVVDSIIPFGAFVLVFMITGAGVATGSEAGAGFAAFLGFTLILIYIVWALTLFARGMTPGKLLLGMRVIKEDGRSAGFLTMFFREWIGKWISGFVLSLGFLWILFDRDNQGWHDKLASTYVIEPSTVTQLAPATA